MVASLTSLDAGIKAASCPRLERCRTASSRADRVVVGCADATQDTPAIRRLRAAAADKPALWGFRTTKRLGRFADPALGVSYETPAALTSPEREQSATERFVERAYTRYCSLIAAPSPLFSAMNSWMNSCRPDAKMRSISAPRSFALRLLAKRWLSPRRP